MALGIVMESLEILQYLQTSETVINSTPSNRRMIVLVLTTKVLLVCLSVYAKPLSLSFTFCGMLY